MMHSSVVESGGSEPALSDADVLVAIAILITEGRIPDKVNSSFRGYSEGPHCHKSKSSINHTCNEDQYLCSRYNKQRSHVLSLWEKSIPVCVEVLLTADCECGKLLATNLDISSGGQQLSAIPLSPPTSSNTATDSLLLEQWYLTLKQRRKKDSTIITTQQLLNAVRSQLHFSQLAAWLSIKSDKKTSVPSTIQSSHKNIIYRLTIPGETFRQSKFQDNNKNEHNFPLSDIGNNNFLKVSMHTLPRLEEIPKISCRKCDKPDIPPIPDSPPSCCNLELLDDRMHFSCTMQGKHKCTYDEDDQDVEYRFKESELKHKSKVRCLNPNQTDKGKDLLCRQDYASFIQNQAVNYMTVPSNSKTNQTSGFHENVNAILGQFYFSTSSSSNSRASESVDVKATSKRDILLNAILRSSRNDNCSSSINIDGPSDDSSVKCDKNAAAECDKNECDVNLSDNNINKIYFNTDNKFMKKCDNNYENKDQEINNSTTPKIRTLLRERTNTITRLIYENRKELFRNYSALETKRKINFEEASSATIQTEESLRKRTLLNNCLIDDDVDKECEQFTIPTVLDQKKFRKSLDSAASMVFHSRTGLPLTSSPAPIRKGTKCFDFDSQLNTVSAIRSALFELPSSSVGDEDSESDCSAVSPCSPDINIVFPKNCQQTAKRAYKPSRSGLLGTFEESVLHGRLEPVSTVQGFTAELGASGLFHPNHKTFPVTVFFYSLGDMDRMSVPYLGHINLGKKGYNVPKTGLVQLTLSNPLGTVVKMFVISYDLSDMPCNSQTFIRQRTLYLPQNSPELQRPDLEYSDKWGHKYLRFLLHLRFMSSKSGRIYLHTDIRMIIFNKSDMDTATGLTQQGHELRSFIYSPTNPKYSPRK